MLRKEFIDMRWRILFMVLFMIFTLFLLIVSKPLVTKMSDFMLSQMDKMPEFFKKMMTQFQDVERFKENDYFLIASWQGKNFGQSLIILALIIAVPLFAREVDKKTIYWLLSTRNRKDVFLNKCFVGWSVIIVVTVLMAFSGPLAMNLAGYHVGYSMTAKILVHEISAVSFLFSLFVLLSVISNDQVKPLIIGSLISIIFPAFSLVKPLSWMNIYPYMFGFNLIREGGHIQWDWTGILWILTGICLYGSYQIFLRREF